MKLYWIAPLVITLALAVVGACAEPEAERAPLESPAATPSVRVAGDVVRIELHQDGTVRFQPCSDAITLELGHAPQPVRSAAPDGGHVANAESTIAGVRPTLKACYQAALAGGLRGTSGMTWEIGIGSDGVVTKTRATFGCNAPESFERCLGEALRPLKFEAPGGQGSTISLPLTFVLGAPAKSPTSVVLDGNALEACVKQANAARPGAKASAVFTATGADVKVERWTGDEALLACAAAVIQKANATFGVELVLGG